MNTLHLSRAASNRLAASYAVSLAVLLHTSAAFATFSAPYQLTPPAAGGYTNEAPGSTHGAWTVTASSGGEARIVGIDQPAILPFSLELQVIDAPGLVGGPANITFEVLAPIPGTFAFDYAAGFGLNPGATIIEFLHNGGVETTLLGDGGGSHTFILLPGDTSFGFHVQTTWIAGPTQQAVLRVTPEPGTGMLLAFGALALLRRRRG